VVEDILSVDDLQKTLGQTMAAPPTTGKILVVGGAGYLGSVLTRKLLAAGYSVRVLDSFIYGRRALEELAGNENLEIVEGDMRNIHTCITALDGVHGVVLLAAIVGDPASKVRPTETIETNVLAAQALASACRLQHIPRFIYASTCSVYGVGDDLLDEDSPLNPVSLYARTKIASEKIILDMGDDYFCPTILRMGTLYGDSPRMRFDLVVNTMAMKSYTDRTINVFGGKQWRPLLGVEDAADVYVACLQADLKDVGNQVFNVGSNEQNYQIDHIAEMIGTALGDIPIQRDDSSLDARDYRVSFAKIEAAIGFRPRQSIAGQARMIYTKLEQGTIRDPAQKIYYNHYFDSSEE
jgi:nucleoside-diphosphate-sugar epimerase